MRTLQSFAILLVLCLLFAISAAPFDAPTAAQVPLEPTDPPFPYVFLSNPGFERRLEHFSSTWKVNRAGRGKRQCNTDTRTVSYKGNCAFRIVASQDMKTVLKQNLSSWGLASGDILEATAMLKGRNLSAGGIMRLHVYYQSGTNHSVTEEIPAGSYDYMPLSMKLILIGSDVRKVRLMFRMQDGSGKLFIDDVSVIYTAKVDPTPTPTFTPTHTPTDTPTDTPTHTPTATDSPSEDTDFDGLPDAWELHWFGHLGLNGQDDPDRDSCNNGCEFSYKLDPLDPDTDKDSPDEELALTDPGGMRFNDFEEAYLYDTLGNDSDTDNDGLYDSIEVLGIDVLAGADFFDSTVMVPACNFDAVVVRDPSAAPIVWPPAISSGTLPDTDLDGRPDGAEYYGQPGSSQFPCSHPNLTDTDGDGLNDGEEVILGVDGFITDPTHWDTDNDGLGDAVDPVPSEVDSDSDGLSDYDEVMIGTNPQDPDTDDDGLNDFEEYMVYGTNPLMADTDSDGTNDFAEIQCGRDPLSASDANEPCEIP